MNQTPCGNCGAQMSGEFCPSCGQRLAGKIVISRILREGLAACSISTSDFFIRSES